MEEIRPVNPETDAPEIAEIYAWYVLNTTITFETEPLTEAQMRRRIEDIASRFPYFVYLRDGRLEGYCYAHPWKERQAYYPTWETTIYLHPSAQRHGVGRRLMDVLTAACRRQGCRSLIACITAENESSCHFHETLGFEKVSHFKEVGEKFGRYLDVVDYQLNLKIEN